MSLDDIGDGIALTRMTMGSRNGVTPGRRIVGIAREEVRHARMLEHVVGGKTTNPRESADIDGKPGGRGALPGSRTRVGLGPGRQT